MGYWTLQWFNFQNFILNKSLFNCEITFFTPPVFHVFTSSVSAVVTFTISRSANVVRPGDSNPAHSQYRLRPGDCDCDHGLWLSPDPPPPGPGPLHPAPALTPGLAQISGDPAWLTQGTLPPPPPPYLTLSRHWRQSTVQNTAQFFGIKTKLQGHSQ